MWCGGEVLNELAPSSETSLIKIHLEASEATEMNPDTDDEARQALNQPYMQIHVTISFTVKSTPTATVSAIWSNQWGRCSRGGLCQFVENSRCERQTHHCERLRGRFSRIEKLSSQLSRNKYWPSIICTSSTMCAAVKKKKSYRWICWIHIFVLKLCQLQIAFFFILNFLTVRFFHSTSERVNYNNWEQFLLILLGSAILLLEIEDSIYCRWVFLF